MTDAAAGLEGSNDVATVGSLLSYDAAHREHALKLVFVFDGPPPARKAQEIAKRRAVKIKYEEESATALARGDFAEAYSKSTMTRG